MPHIRTFAAVLSAALPVANAWGTLGHETVAFIAQDRMAAHTVSWAQGVLDNTSTSYLAGIAAWADTYRYTAAGTFSAPFHFIDAEDSPPSSCSVDYDRDCGAKGCVVSAIANYTQRVVSTTLSNTEVNYALRFLVHFVGDIHQPLHDEALEIGGNDIDVTFAGASTNLHHIWDTEIPEKFVGGYTLSDAKAWAQTLNTATKSGIYASQVASWTKGLEVTDPVTTALDWASEANAYVCSTVMPNGQAAVEDVDLSGAYYTSAISVVELQIARAGVRLAAYLDAIAMNQKVLTKRLVQDDVDMSGADLLPDPRPLSKAKLVREAVGYGSRARERLERILQNVPVIQNEPEWRCRTWIKNALVELEKDGQVVGTAQLSWEKIERTARDYVAQKTAAGRYQQEDIVARPRPMWDMLEEKEIVP